MRKVAQMWNNLVVVCVTVTRRNWPSERVNFVTVISVLKID